MSIKIEKGNVIINLNKCFYDISSIKESINDFKRVCSARFEDDDSAVRITLKPKERILLKILGHEFCNYVLALMKNKTLV